MTNSNTGCLIYCKTARQHASLPALGALGGSLLVTWHKDLDFGEDSVLLEKELLHV